MYELFGVGIVIVAFIFFYLSIRSKGEFSRIQFLYLSLGFISIILGSAVMANVTANTMIQEMMFGFMGINIASFIVVIVFFILFFIKNVILGAKESAEGN